MHWILWHEEEAVIYDGIYLQEYVQRYWLYVHVQVYPQLNWIMQQLLSPLASSSSLLSPSSHPRNAIHAIHRHSHTPPTQSLEAILLFGVSLMEFVALFIRWDFAIRTPTQELCVAPSPGRQASALYSTGMMCHWAEPGSRRRASSFYVAIARRIYRAKSKKPCRQIKVYRILVLNWTVLITSQDAFRINRPHKTIICINHLLKLHSMFNVSKSYIS